MRFVCCNEKTLTNDKNKNIEFETQKKVAVRNHKKKKSFDMGGHLSLVSRFGARWQGLERSGWRERSKEHEKIHNTF